MTTSESKGRFFYKNESIRIDSHKESNRIDSNRELECSTDDQTRKLRSANYLLIYLHIRAASVLRHFVTVFVQFCVFWRYKIE